MKYGFNLICMIDDFLMSNFHLPSSYRVKKKFGKESARLYRLLRTAEHIIRDGEVDKEIDFVIESKCDYCNSALRDCSLCGVSSFDTSENGEYIC